MHRGSILGPLLFNTFSGDLFLFVTHNGIVNNAESAVDKNPENLLRTYKMPQFSLIQKRLISITLLSTKTKMLDQKLNQYGVMIKLYGMTIKPLLRK